MKFNTHSVKVKTNIKDAKTYDCEIADIGMVIELLRNGLYGNPLQTLIQEYISNAVDATIESGTNTPLKITLPTKIEPVIKIRDFGVGLDEETFSNVFRKYAASTKRGDNTQKGGFGIGGKSAWAYTDSFMVTSYFNGQVWVYVGTVETAKGSFTLLPQYPMKTTEPNGVEIEIPIKLFDEHTAYDTTGNIYMAEHKVDDVIAARDAVLRTTMFWKTKPNLEGILKNEIPSYYTGVKTVLSGEGWSIYSNEYSHFFNGRSHTDSGIVISVDGIPYYLENKFTSQYTKKLSNLLREGQLIVLEVKNGEVDIAASRESLKKDKENKTVQFLNSKCVSTCDSILKAIEDQLAKVKTFKDLIVVHNDIRTKIAIYKETEKKLKGVNLKLDGNFVNLPDRVTQYTLIKQRTRCIMSRVEVGRINLNSDFDGSLYINDCGDGVGIEREKIRFLLDGKTNHNIYIITPELATVLKAKKISAIKLPKSHKTWTKPKGQQAITELRMYGWQRWERKSIHINIESNEQKYIYMVKETQTRPSTTGLSELVNNDLRSALSLVQEKDDEYQICMVSKSVAKKICDDDNFMTMKDYLSDFYTKFPISNEIKLDIASGKWNGLGALDRLKGTKAAVEDKDLQALISHSLKMSSNNSLYDSYTNTKLYEKEANIIIKEQEKMNELRIKVEQNYEWVKELYSYGYGTSGKNKILRFLLEKGYKND